VVIVAVIAGLWFLMLVFALALCRMSARADAESDRHWRAQAEAGAAATPEARPSVPTAAAAGSAAAAAPAAAAPPAAGTRRALAGRGQRLTV
jgi:hypothetical protein